MDALVVVNCTCVLCCPAFRSRQALHLRRIRPISTFIDWREVTRHTTNVTRPEVRGAECGTKTRIGGSQNHSHNQAQPQRTGIKAFKTARLALPVDKIKMLEDADTISIISLVFAILSIAASLYTFHLQQRNDEAQQRSAEAQQCLQTSIDHKRLFSVTSSHPWNRANWLFTADAYLGLPFRIGQVDITLRQEVYEYAINCYSVGGHNLPQVEKSAIKAVLIDCCEELGSLLDLTKRNKVDRQFIRSMVNTLVYRIVQSNQQEARDYEYELSCLATEFQLSFDFTFPPPVQPAPAQRPPAELNWRHGVTAPNELDLPILLPWT